MNDIFFCFYCFNHKLDEILIYLTDSCGKNTCNAITPYCCKLGSVPKCVISQRNCAPTIHCGAVPCPAKKPFCCMKDGRHFCTRSLEVCDVVKCGSTVCPKLKPYCCKGSVPFCSESKDCKSSPAVMCGNSECNGSSPYCCKSKGLSFCTKNEDQCVRKKFACGSFMCSLSSPFCCELGHRAICTKESECALRKCDSVICEGPTAVCCRKENSTFCASSQVSCDRASVCGSTLCKGETSFCCTSNDSMTSFCASNASSCSVSLQSTSNNEDANQVLTTHPSTIQPRLTTTFINDSNNKTTSTSFNKTVDSTVLSISSSTSDKKDGKTEDSFLRKNIAKDRPLYTLHNTSENSEGSGNEYSAQNDTFLNDTEGQTTPVVPTQPVTVPESAYDLSEEESFESDPNNKTASATTTIIISSSQTNNQIETNTKPDVKTVKVLSSTPPPITTVAVTYAVRDKDQKSEPDSVDNEKYKDTTMSNSNANDKLVSNKEPDEKKAESLVKDNDITTSISNYTQNDCVLLNCSLSKQICCRNGATTFCAAGNCLLQDEAKLV